MRAGAEAAIHASRWGAGLALDGQQRSHMESRFGRDLRRVRLHTGPGAAAAARALKADAFTRGSHIVFGAGRYAPGTRAGHQLLAHELAHVVQQDATSAREDVSLHNGARERAETEAGRVAGAVLTGSAGPVTARVPPNAVLKQEESTESREEEGPGFWGTIGGGLLGEFNEDPSFAMIGVDVGVSLVPILDQASDIRDIIAHLYYLIVRRQYDVFMRWVGLVFTLIGLIPELGSAIKGASKFVIRGVETAISHIGDLLRAVGRFFPDVTDLGRLRGFVVRNWDRLVAQGMGAWNRTADRVTRWVGMIPSWVGGRLGILRDGWQRITRLAPARLTEAFAWVRRQWDTVVEALQRRLRPADAAAPPPPRIAGEEVFGELSTELGMEATEASGRRGTRAAATEAVGGGLIGPRGAPGTVDIAVQPHSTASAVRGAYGVTGQAAQSAHIGATSLLRSLPGYSRSSALTTLLPTHLHRAFDQHWLRWIANRRSAIRAAGGSNFTATLTEVLEAQRQAIRQIPGMPARQLSTLEFLLEREIRELASGLPDGFSTRVPLPDVH